MTINHLHRIRNVVLAVLVIFTFVVTDLSVCAAKTTELQGVALHRKGEQWKKWAWLSEEVAKKMAGEVKMKPTTTFEEIGLKGSEALRLLKAGIVDVTEVLPGYVGGDFPLIEATEFPGVDLSWEKRKEMFNNWTQNVIAPREDLMGGRIIGTMCWNSILLFTKFPLNTIDDLKGKKIRVFATNQAQYLNSLGAEPVSMPISEVYGALQRGIIDGVVTGPDQIGAMKLWEITSNVIDFGFPPLGSYIVMSSRSWSKLSEEQQKKMLEIGVDLTELAWKLGQDNNRIGLDLAKENNMTIVPFNPEWRTQLRQVLQDVIVPEWAKLVGDDGVAAFNKYLAPYVGFTK